MRLDTRGLPLSTASAKTAAAFDPLVTGYLTQRADTPDHLDALLEADPDFALAHCMNGYFAMLAFKQAVVPVAVQGKCWAAAAKASSGSPRSRPTGRAATTCSTISGGTAPCSSSSTAMMALTATGRTAAAERMIEAMRTFANGRGTVPPIVRDYVLPIAEAQLAHAAGRHAEAVALMRPAIGGMYRLGGSHTQQDVLEQLFVDAALKAGSTADIRLALERVAGRRAIPPERFIGWREAANRAAAGAS